MGGIHKERELALFTKKKMELGMSKDNPIIENRRGLFDFLEDQMCRSFEKLRDKKNLEPEQGLVKTFLLEFDWDKEETRKKGELKFLKDEFLIPSKRGAGGAELEIKTTKEEGFYEFIWNIGNKKYRTFFDTSSDPDRRFWFVYTVADALVVNSLFNKISNYSHRLDRSWLWPSFLQEIQSLGEFRGFGLDYDFRKFDRIDKNRESLKYLKMQMWGGPETQKVFNYMSESLGEQVVLSKVRLRYSIGDSSSSNAFSVEDLKYNGKLTTKGTSFQAHQNLALIIRDKYSVKVKSIEEKCAIKIESEEEKFSILGEPVFFNLNGADIRDLDNFCEVVFSGTQPFRIWGTVESGGKKGSDNECRLVSAVDMHTGGRIFFEVFHDLIAMYIYNGTCGNTVIRFFTNLQHTLSQAVKGEMNDGFQLF